MYQVPRDSLYPEKEGGAPHQMTLHLPISPLHLHCIALALQVLHYTIGLITLQSIARHCTLLDHMRVLYLHDLIQDADAKCMARNALRQTRN